MTAGLARVTISAPRRRLDVALPEHVPLAELLPEVLRHAGDGLADDGERHGGWLLRRADGAALRGGQGLQPQGVRDGEVLFLVPARVQWPEPEYDDVVEAIADGARRRGAAWSPRATRGVGLIAAGALLAVGLLAVLHGGPQWSGAAPLGLGLAALLTGAGAVAARAHRDGLVGAALGGYAMPYAFAGGALAVASGDPAGPLGPVRWLGAPELLAGSVALLLVAVLGAIGVAAYLRVFAAGATAGLLGAAAALAAFGLPMDGAAAILLAVLVGGVGVPPLLAIRLGRLPLPPVTLPVGDESLDLARERPDRARVFAAVARAEELLTGMLIGYAVLAAAAALLLVIGGGTAGRVLVAVGATALLLRSRLFVTIRQRVPLVAAGLTGLTILAVALVPSAGEPVLLVLVAGGALAALVTVAAGVTYAQRPPSPYLGRAADLLDTLMVISMVPVACAVLDLYTKARGLVS